MSDDQFTKLFKYIQDFRGEVNLRFEKTDGRIDALTSSIDGFIKRIDHYETEQAARDHKIDRLERWIEEIAKKTGVKLPV